MNCSRFSSIPALLLLSPAFLSAQTFVLQEGVDGYTGARDNSIYDGPTTQENTNGGHPYLYSGMTRQGFARRALIAFDLSSLPNDRPVIAAELTVVANLQGGEDVPYTFTLHRLTTDWGEGTTSSGSGPGGLGEPAAEGDATWLSNFHDISTWSNEGGDFIGTASATGPLGGSNPIGSIGGVGLAQDIEFFLSKPDQNFGWILIGDEQNSQSAKQFHSGESATEFVRPKLTIVLEELPQAPSDTWVIY